MDSQLIDALIRCLFRVAGLLAAHGLHLQAEGLSTDHCLGITCPHQRNRKSSLLQLCLQASEIPACELPLLGENLKRSRLELPQLFRQVVFPMAGAFGGEQQLLRQTGIAINGHGALIHRARR